ncbi:hypothetical protein JK386_10110 [Nocardioides sp. zg-536]|uniref:Copper chaperone PCu(A)C n=1 Tax=Nocardioides faecalis TaxID=2803858 RepID=A0A939BW62_9ACTN|nr:hypothetical protein [Nocardioides faecalis]MBM9460257.1 hypothetical protein [Nocardioides faecalis]QVI59957.1 hypothetical protein KG111_06495 [Nocardioides faecalis]
MRTRITRCWIAAPALLLGFSACGVDTQAPTADRESSPEVPVRIAQASLASGVSTVTELVSTAQATVLATAGESVEEPLAMDPTIVMTTQEFTVDKALSGLAGEKAVKVKFTGGLVTAGTKEPYRLQLEGQPPFEKGHQYFLALLGPGEDGTYGVLGGAQGRYEVADGVLHAVAGTDEDAVVSLIDGTKVPDTTRELAALDR